MKIIHRVPIAFILLLMSIASVLAQQVDVKLHTEWTIGDREDAEEEYLFSEPEHISTDSKLNVYVADRNSSRIRVFDKSGKFIKSIGNRGQGPGEFQEITCMVVDKDDNLVVVDRRNHRFTRFGFLGKDFDTYPFLKNAHFNPMFIVPVSNGYLISFARPVDDNKLEGVPGNKLLHIFSPDFSSIIKSFCPIEDILDTKVDFLRHLARTRSIRIASSNDKIIIIPNFYEGQILGYNLQRNEWRPAHFPDRTFASKAWKIIQMKDYPKADYPHPFLLLSSYNSQFLVSVYRFSLGAAILKNGDIIHFYYNRTGPDYARVELDVFNAGGKLIGSGIVKSFKKIYDKEGFLRIELLARDRDDNLYIKDSREFPVIHKMRLSYKIK